VTKYWGISNVISNEGEMNRDTGITQTKLQIAAESGKWKSQGNLAEKLRTSPSGSAVK